MTDHVNGWEGNSRELTIGSGWEMRGGHFPEEVTFPAECEGGRRSNYVDGAGGTLWAEGTLHAQLCGWGESQHIPASELANGAGALSEGEAGKVCR